MNQQLCDMLQRSSSTLCQYVGSYDIVAAHV